MTLDHLALDAPAGWTAVLIPLIAAIGAPFVTSWFTRRMRRDELADGEEKQVRSELRSDLRECERTRDKFRDRYLVEKAQRLRAEAEVAQLKAMIYARGMIPPEPLHRREGE